MSVNGGGLLELFAGILEYVAAPKYRPGAIRLGCSDYLEEILDGDACDGQVCRADRISTIR